MSYYLKNTFFNTMHKFEGGEGKRLRDVLGNGSVYSFLQTMNSDDVSNAEKRDAKPWTDADKDRADAALAIRDNFAMTIGAIGLAGRQRDGAPALAAFSEKFSETFSKVANATYLADANADTKTAAE